MEYSFIAADKTGIKQKGKLEANDQKEVIDYLRQKGLVPLKIKLNGGSGFNPFSYFARSIVEISAGVIFPSLFLSNPAFCLYWMLPLANKVE